MIDTFDVLFKQVMEMESRNEFDSPVRMTRFQRSEIKADALLMGIESFNLEIATIERFCGHPIEIID